MNKVYARELIHWSLDELWEFEENLERFILEFDDLQIETTWQETIVSWLYWEYYRQYPDTPMYAHVHVQGECLGPVLQAKLLERAKLDVRSVYPDADEEDLNLIAYQITNANHNLAVGDLEPYVGSLDALDLLQIHQDEELNAVRDEIYENPNKRTINKIYGRIKNKLMIDTAYRKNPIAISLNQGTIKVGQLLQIIGMRGYCSEINQMIFKTLIPVGFMHGLSRLSFFGMESRSGSIAMRSTDDPVKMTEYYNRELQLLNYGITEIDFEDCGTDETIPWRVTEFDLDTLLSGKYFIENGKNVLIRKKDRHLVGKTIELRTPVYCHHEDDAVLCKYCVGEVAHSFQRNVNVQYQATVEQNEAVSQNSISVKHLLMSAESDSYAIDPFYADYIDNAMNDKDLSLTSKIWSKDNLRIIFDRRDIMRLSDIVTIQNFKDHDISTFTKLRTVIIEYTEGKETITQSIPLNHGSYMPFLTAEFLLFLRDYGYDIVGNTVVVNLQHWPEGEIIFRLPERRATVLEFAISLKKEIFAIGDEAKDAKVRLRMDLRDPMLLSKSIRDIAEMTNSRFSVSLPIIELVMLAMTGRDPMNGDFRLPRKGTGAHYAPQKAIMNGRSIGGKAGYERQFEMRINPDYYLNEEVPDHPMDELLVPMGTRSSLWTRS